MERIVFTGLHASGKTTFYGLFTVEPIAATPAPQARP
jgi:hypothetical protein